MSARTPLRQIREQKPLIHQITNYVVMNETANATLALGALSVMAHAIEEVEEMVGSASALILNIGTLSAHWIEAMLVAGLDRTSTACRSSSIQLGRERHGSAPKRQRGFSTRWTSMCFAPTRARLEHSWMSRLRCSASSRSALRKRRARRQGIGLVPRQSL